MFTVPETMCGDVAALGCSLIRAVSSLRTVRIACQLSLLLLVSACSTPYLADRGRDALDIFTLAGGIGIGAKAHVGPLSTGVLYQQEHFGVRNGEVYSAENSDEYREHKPWDEAYLFMIAEASNHGPVARDRGKDCQTSGFLVPLGWWETDDFCHLPPNYFTQVEAVVGLGVGFRLGFNPGELLDFLLGWTTLDIFRDDLGKTSTRPPPKTARYR
jgi:hypothetical protein